MPAPALPATLSLQTCREELVFTQSRGLADPAAKDLVDPITQVLGAWADVHGQQLALWDAQTRADALVAAADDGLDGLVDRFVIALLSVVGQNREDSRYTLYFKVTPSALKQPVLGPELETLKGWSTVLATEKEPALAAFSKELKAGLKRAGEAIKARTKADADNDAFRKTGALATYFGDIATARDTLYLSLETRRVERKKDRSWPNQFFRKRARAKPSGEGQAAKEAKLAEKKAHARAVAEAEAKVKAAQKLLRETKKTKKG